jgi:hypothetical protein
MSTGAAHGRGMYGGTKYEAMDGAEKVSTLNALIAQWKEPGMPCVVPARVIPGVEAVGCEHWEIRGSYPDVDTLHRHYESRKYGDQRNARALHRSVNCTQRLHAA